MDGVELMAVMLLMMSAVSTDTSKMNQILKNAKKPVYLTYPHALDMLSLKYHMNILIDASFMETLSQDNGNGHRTAPLHPLAGSKCNGLIRPVILFLR